jgi:hypothetical protein
MRKIFVTLLLLGSAFAAFAQGTVFFSNNAFDKISSGFYGSGPYGGVVPATPGLFNFGLFYGTGATQPATLTFLGSVSGVNSATSAGLIVNQAGNPVTALQIPGTTPGETDVWVQIAGWSASYGTDWAAARIDSRTRPGAAYFGQTTIINVAPNAGGLGPATGLGAFIWQFPTGTDPYRFPLGGFVLYTVLSPEPSTTALLSLGITAALIFRRRR